MNDKKKWLEAQLKRTGMGIKRLAKAAGFAHHKVYSYIKGHAIHNEQFFVECIEGIPDGKQRNYAEQLKRVRALKLTIYGAAALFKVSYETMHEYFRREKTSNVIYDRIDAWFGDGMKGLRKAREQKRCETTEHGCGEQYVRRMLARNGGGDYMHSTHLAISYDAPRPLHIMDGKVIQK